MQRATAGGVTLFTILMSGASPAGGQATVGADLDLFSSYVWRGLSLTNKPVAEPGLWVSFPAGNASLIAGGWANIDLGRYDDISERSESGGTSAFNLAEFDPYAEVAFPLGNATVTGGVIGYIYPNDDPGLTSSFNTWEIYGKAGLDVPLSPELSIYYDIDKVKGAYIEGKISHSLAASERILIDLGATAGFSAGQDADLDDLGTPRADFFNYAENGFTYLDLSAGVPISAGVFSITPVVHFVINGDELTKITSFDERTGSPNSNDAKIWGGLSVSWANEVNADAETMASPE
ncbi:MAG TPA: TorF family putative porin [Gemmatimonadales bacterium]|nr:TorF family putative porin [Gemmatimonadales bacterium]